MIQNVCSRLSPSDAYNAAQKMLVGDWRDVTFQAKVFNPRQLSR